MHSSRVAAAVLVIAVTAGPAAASPPSGLATQLYDHGNLRVALACADSYLVSTRTGLRVYVDGDLVDELATNGHSYVTTDEDGDVETEWAPTDIGFLVAPGRHHLRIEAPDCLPDERDLDLAADHAERVTGRLGVRDPALATPTGAPSWYSFVIGGVYAPLGPTRGTGGDGSFGSSYTVASTSQQGLLVSGGIERRHFALWIDETFGWGSTTGMVAWRQPPVGTGSQGPFVYHGSLLANGLAVRVGARVPLGPVALAVGGGLGGTLIDYLESNVATAPTTVAPIGPEGPAFDWYIPLWAAVTLKPSCNWGVQAIASYEVDPSNGFAGSLALLGGLELQPAGACSEPAHVDVRP